MKKLLNIAVLVSGRGSNLQAIIDRIEAGELAVDIKIVISDKKEARGLKRAESHGIKSVFLDPADFASDKEYEEKMIEILKKEEVELVVMAGFMKMMSPFFIKYFENQVINIHPSLLPSFRGLDAQKQALRYGVKVTGCTVHFASEKMDDGPIILQKVVEIKEDDTVESLSERILEEEHRILPKAIRLYSEGKLKIVDKQVYILK